MSQADLLCSNLNQTWLIDHLSDLSGSTSGSFKTTERNPPRLSCPSWWPRAGCTKRRLDSSSLRLWAVETLLLIRGAWRALCWTVGPTKFQTNIHSRKSTWFQHTKQWFQQAGKDWFTLDYFKDGYRYRATWNTVRWEDLICQDLICHACDITQSNKVNLQCLEWQEGNQEIRRLTIGRMKRSNFGGFRVNPSPTKVTFVTIRFQAFPEQMKRLISWNCQWFFNWFIEYQLNIYWSLYNCDLR